MRSPTALLFLVSIVWLHLNALVDAQQPSLQIKASRPSAIYEVGETAHFTVTANDSDGVAANGVVAYVVDDFIANEHDGLRLPKGELRLDGGQTIEVRSAKPGFVRCHVSWKASNGKTLKAVAGVGFSPTKLAPSLSIPADFYEFWANQKKTLHQIAPTSTLIPLKDDDPSVAAYDIKVACVDDTPVSGYFALPRNATPKTLPAILWVHGAGVRSSSLPNAMQGAKAGMLSLDMNAHGLDNGKPAQYYRDLSGGRLKNYRHDGRDNRDTVYFRGMFLRLVRALDFLTARPEWDGKTLVVAGHSQGGGQALAAGGLDPRVTMIAVGVPALCDHSGRAAGRVNGWPKIVPLNADGNPDPAVLRAASYFDGVHFASRCKADAIMSVGFIDAVCPPSSCYAAFNQLQGQKLMLNEPAMGHAAPQHIKDAFFERIQQHIQATR